MTGWRELDPDELNRQYRLARLVPDLDAVLAGYARASAAARARFPVRTDLRYGPEGPQTLDLFPGSRPGAPLLVFVHGGFWQESGKEAAAFPAPGLLAGGVAFAALGYGLAPRYRLEEMVATTARAVRWLAAHAAGLGVDPARIHLAGPTTSRAGGDVPAVPGRLRGVRDDADRGRRPDRWRRLPDRCGGFVGLTSWRSAGRHRAPLTSGRSRRRSRYSRTITTMIAMSSAARTGSRSEPVRVARYTS